MTKKGDKFIVEIGDVFYDTSMKTYYKIKGFNTLVFDDFGLERLTKILPLAGEAEEGGKRFNTSVVICDEYGAESPWRIACSLIDNRESNAWLLKVCEHIQNFLKTNESMQ